MNFSQSITTCMSKYATFSGTASRSEFWFFILFVWLLFFAASIIDGLIYGPTPDPTPGPIYFLVSTAFFIPLLSAGSRRLHDIGNSGWWQLLYFTIIGILPLVIMLAIGTKNKDNRFKPKSRRSTKTRVSQ